MSNKRIKIDISDSDSENDNDRTNVNVPFYKLIPNTPISVDAFSYGKINNVSCYLLSHAHSDHYTKLNKNWDFGTIYCSEVTAKLIKSICKVDDDYIIPLKFNVVYDLPNDIRLTLIDANHCPGSSIFVIEGKTFRYLHCGDFRASPIHSYHPSIKNKFFNLVYIDNTYLNPSYCFPPQPQVIKSCVDLVNFNIKGVTNSRTNLISKFFKPISSSNGGQNKNIKNVLVVIGTYTIGKEKIVKSLSKSLNSKVYVDKYKHNLLKDENDEELNEILTLNPLDAQIHVKSLQLINHESLTSYLNKYKNYFSRVIGLKPTGWSYKSNSNNNSKFNLRSFLNENFNRTFTHFNISSTTHSTHLVTVYTIPYSEHSSFFELTCFGLSINTAKFIPTVGVGNPYNRQRYQYYFNLWINERKNKPDLILNPRSSDYW